MLFPSLRPVDRIGVKQEATSTSAEDFFNAEGRLNTSIIEARHVGRAVPVIRQALTSSGNFCVVAIFSLVVRTTAKKSLAPKLGERLQKASEGTNKSLPSVPPTFI